MRTLPVEDCPTAKSIPSRRNVTRGTSLSDRHTVQSPAGRARHPATGGNRRTGPTSLRAAEGREMIFLSAFLIFFFSLFFMHLGTVGWARCGGGAPDFQLNARPAALADDTAHVCTGTLGGQTGTWRPSGRVVSCLAWLTSAHLNHLQPLFLSPMFCSYVAGLLCFHPLLLLLFLFLALAAGVGGAGEIKPHCGSSRRPGHAPAAGIIGQVPGQLTHQGGVVPHTRSPCSGAVRGRARACNSTISYLRQWNQPNLT